MKVQKCPGRQINIWKFVINWTFKQSWDFILILIYFSTFLPPASFYQPIRGINAPVATSTIQSYILCLFLTTLFCCRQLSFSCFCQMDDWQIQKQGHIAIHCIMNTLAYIEFIKHERVEVIVGNRTQQEPTVQIDVSDAALNHHRYRLPRVLADRFSSLLLEGEKKSWKYKWPWQKQWNSEFSCERDLIKQHLTLKTV